MNADAAAAARAADAERKWQVQHLAELLADEPMEGAG